MKITLNHYIPTVQKRGRIIETYIHIGYPKTATTTLQNHLFRHLKAFDILGQPVTREDDLMQKLIHIITDCEPMEYDEAFVREEIKRYQKNSKMLLSEESLVTGSSLSGRVDRMEISKRLKSLFPDARIVIVIREQASIIKSFYLQRIKIDQHFRSNFDEWFDYNIKNMHKENIFQYFHYDKVVDHYASLFGEANICVLTFEDFLDDKKTFIRRLLNFFEASSSDMDKYYEKIDNRHDNPTLTRGNYLLQKYRNRNLFLKSLIPTPLKRYLKKLIDTGSKISISMNNEQKKIIHQVYGKGNTCLSTKYSLNLEKLGYTMEE